MAQAIAWTTAYRVPDWVPSDTEESVVGTEWHQEAIGALAEALRVVAWRRGAPWGVCEQVGLEGLRHDDGSPYDPRPDVMVLPRPLPSGDLSAIGVAEGGVPLFIAEVASPSTHRIDVAEKRRAYEAIGVGSYLILDPGGRLLGERLRGWQVIGGRSRAWKAGADGWWQSAEFACAFRVESPFIAVRDRDGRVIDRSLQSWIRAEEERARADAEHARADRLADDLRAAERRAAELEAELRHLRGL